ncbi:MAG: porin, partial [Hyphomicrobiales bacterium]|nr:porin [Hyphomicrobiales bacterium]
FYAGDYEDAGGSDITVSTLAYTASFGGGMSATLALENNRDRLVNGFAWNNNGVAFDGLTARTNQIPDVVGVFRVDQGWGSAQLSAAMHNVNLVDGAGISVSKTGFAVQGGVKFNVPSMGAGDAFWLQAAYASAALSYIGVGGGPQDILGNGFNHTDGDVVIDGGTAAAPNVRSSSGFSVLGAFEHHFGPTFWVAPYIGYLNVSYGNAPAAGAGFPLQTNWNQIIAGVDTHWDPVTNLDFNLLLRYSHLNQGTPGGTVAPVTVPVGTAFKANTDTFFVRLNIERDF